MSSVTIFQKLKKMDLFSRSQGSLCNPFRYEDVGVLGEKEVFNLPKLLPQG